MKRSNIKVNLIIICLFGIAACLILLIPQIRQVIIKLTEQFLMRRALRDQAKWHQVLFTISIIGSIFFGLFLLYFLFDCKKFVIKILKIVCSFLNNCKYYLNNCKYYLNNCKYFLNNCKYLIYMKNEIQKVFCKNIIIAILCMFGLYTFAIIGIIRADFIYKDDLGRTIYGYRGWENYSRYMSNFLAVFLHADTHINNISPFPQIIAAIFIAIASVLLVYIISDGKVTKTALFLALPIGLSPYFLECFSYKFDSPYMALSVLASIVPFLFMRNYSVFSVSSIILLLIMCMTYQASSGIYVIIVIMLCFKMWNERVKPGKEIIKFAAVSASSYCASMFFFRVFLMHNTNTYRSTDVYPINRLVSGIVNNFISYMRLVNEDFGFIWKFLLLILCSTFIITSVFFIKRNKIAVLTVSLMAITAMCLMSFGVYLAFTEVMSPPRGMYGFGVFIACIAVYLSNMPKKIILLPAILLCWCFFVFSFTYGNALSEQKRYNNFRTEILLHDLSILFPNKTQEQLLIRLENSEGFAPSIQNISIRNPVIRRLVPVNLMANWYWSNIILTRYYNFNLQQDESIEENELNEVLNTYYHTIKSDGRKVLVILK